MRNTIIPTAVLVLLLLCPGIRARADEGNGWVLLDGVVATVDGAPVLMSDVHMEADLGLLEARGGSGRFEELLDVYLNRQLILREIDELGGYRLQSGEAEGAFRGYLAGYSDSFLFLEKLHRWGIDEGEVFRRLKNALLTTLYTESRIQFLVNVTPSDIEAAYLSDPDRWDGKDLYESWERIRGELIRDRFAVEKERWLTTLRDRYELVITGRAGEETP